MIGFEPAWNRFSGCRQRRQRRRDDMRDSIRNSIAHPVIEVCSNPEQLVQHTAQDGPGAVIAFERNRGETFNLGYHGLHLLGANVDGIDAHRVCFNAERA